MCCLHLQCTVLKWLEENSSESAENIAADENMCSHLHEIVRSQIVTFTFWLISLFVRDAKSYK
jgi:hypothetical protein